MDLGFSIAGILLGIFGGVGLFIYGMNVLSGGLQNLAADKIRNILGKFTKNKFAGLLTGTGITAIIQSSSIMTVMLVGFVNAGLITFQQSLAVILGANIGSTLIVQLIALKLTNLALPLVGIGSFLYFFNETNKKLKAIGKAIFGLGLIFLAMNIISIITQPFAHSEVVRQAFINFGNNALLGLATGFILTSLIQSSAVTVGILIVLASGDLITLAGAIPIIFGSSIGTSITAIIASYNTTISAKRAAAAHTFMRIIGVIFGMFVFPLYIYLVRMIPFSHPSNQIANFFTLFNIINAFILLPFTGLIARQIIKMFPGEDTIFNTGLLYIDKNLLKTPGFAFTGLQKEMNRLVELVKSMFKDVYNLYSGDESDADCKKAMFLLNRKNEAIKEITEQINNYTIKLAQADLSSKQAEMLPVLSQIINDINRSSVHADRIGYLIKTLKTNKKEFNNKQKIFLNKIFRGLSIILDETHKSVKSLESETASKAMIRTEKLKKTISEANPKITKKKPTEVFVIYTEILNNSERIIAHTENICYVFKNALLLDVFKGENVSEKNPEKTEKNKK